jgi:hypothetical protein
MAATHRPRHIRDIAHLYLSRKPTKDRSLALNLFVCAGGKDCLSGFHASNIAAGMSMRRATVRVFELSRLLPNVAYYFSHRPEIYLKPLVGAARDCLPGVDGITIMFDSSRLSDEPPAAESFHVNLIHLPTLGATEDSAELLSTLRDRCLGERWVIYLTRDAGEPEAPRFGEWLGASETFTLRLPRRGEPTGMPAAVGKSVGAIRGWEARVEERLPVVLRNRDSRLARDYLALCESVLVQINSLRRRREIGKREQLSRIRAARR